MVKWNIVLEYPENRHTLNNKNTKEDALNSANTLLHVSFFHFIYSKNILSFYANKYTLYFTTKTIKVFIDED